MDFQEKLHGIFNKYKDESKPLIKEKTEAELKQIIEDLTKHNWMLRKSSLPPGLDQTIMWNLTEEEASYWLQKLKPKIIKHDIETNQYLVHYYRKVRNDGYLNDIYANPKQLIKEESNEDNNRSGERLDIIQNNQTDPYNSQWVD